MRLTILFVFFFTFFQAQRDTSVSVPLVGIHIGGQIPSGDLVKRFGPNMLIGATFDYKTNKNWIYGINFGYLYGTKVKEDVMKQLKTAEGYVVDNAGNPADLRITQRGLSLRLSAGKVFSLFGANKNSGLMISFGAGFLQHKINLYDAEQKIAAINGSMRYGYDRLTFGFSVSEFIGYMYLSKNRLLNFYAGFELMAGFTQNRRSLNFDTMQTDHRKRTDIYVGPRVGFILPLYKRMPDDFYYD